MLQEGSTDRDELHAAQLENAHLEETIHVLREELEKAQIRHDTDLQELLRLKEDELQQLRATIEALREELERTRLNDDAEKSALEGRLRDEIAQLQAAIRAMRERLAEHEK